MKKFVLLSVVCVLSAVSVFAQSGGIKGKVRNPKGNGVANATITARQDGKDLKTAKSDGKGNFVLEGLKDGKYNVVFEASGFGTGLLNNVEVKKGKMRDLGDRMILSVDQGTLVLIRGSVFNQDGRSVTGAKVVLERMDTDGSTKKLDTIYTNVSGEFTFRQPEGTTKFLVTASFDDSKESKEVEVNQPAIYRLALTLNLKK
jgi:Carboxypeptidase regulatory-like domain